MVVLYADTSVIVKRYQSEEGTAFVNALYDLAASQGERILTSYFSLIEFGSAIMRLHREKTFTHKEAIGLLNLFRNESERLIGFWPVTQSALHEALRVVIEYSLKPPDALQLATALEVLSFHPHDESNFYFVADDEVLCKAAQREGLQVLKPRDPAALNLLKSLGKE